MDASTRSSSVKAGKLLLKRLTESRKGICREFYCLGTCTNGARCGFYHPHIHMQTSEGDVASVTQLAEDRALRIVKLEEEVKQIAAQSTTFERMYKSLVAEITIRTAAKIKKCESELHKFMAQDCLFGVHEMRVNQLDSRNTSLVRDISTLTGERDELRKRLRTLEAELDNYRKQEDQLRLQIASTIANCDRVAARYQLQLKDDINHYRNSLTEVIEKMRRNIIDANMTNVRQSTEIELLRVELRNRTKAREIYKESKKTPKAQEAGEDGEVVPVLLADVKQDSPCAVLDDWSDDLDENPADWLAGTDLHESLLAVPIYDNPSIATSSDTKHLWHWEDDGPVWRLYCDMLQTKISEAVQNLANSPANDYWVNFEVGKHHYKISASALTQTNVETKKVRKIELRPCVTAYKLDRVDLPTFNTAVMTNEETTFIVDLMQETMPKINIVGIVKHFNKVTLSRYHLLKWTYRNAGTPIHETFGFHGTRTNDPELLVKNGHSVLFAQDGYLGRAFYIAESALYAHDYAYKKVVPLMPSAGVPKQSVQQPATQPLVIPPYVPLSGMQPTFIAPKPPTPVLTETIYQMLGVYATLGNIENSTQIDGKNVCTPSDGFQSRTLVTNNSRVFGMYDPHQAYCTYIISYKMAN